MKKLLLASVLAIASFPGLAADADDEVPHGDPPAHQVRFRPSQQAWQCNDLRHSNQHSSRCRQL